MDCATCLVAVTASTVAVPAPRTNTSACCEDSCTGVCRGKAWRLWRRFHGGRWLTRCFTLSPWCLIHRSSLSTPHISLFLLTNLSPLVYKSAHLSLPSVLFILLQKHYPAVMAVRIYGDVHHSYLYPPTQPSESAYKPLFYTSAVNMLLCSVIFSHPPRGPFAQKQSGTEVQRRKRWDTVGPMSDFALAPALKTFTNLLLGRVTTLTSCERSFGANLLRPIEWTLSPHLSNVFHGPITVLDVVVGNSCVAIATALNYKSGLSFTTFGPELPKVSAFYTLVCLFYQEIIVDIMGVAYSKVAHIVHPIQLHL